MKVLPLLLFCILASNALSQLYFEADSTTYYDRISGEIDTVDLSNSSVSGTFDGGLCFTCPAGLPSDQLFHQYTDRQFMDPLSYEKIRFSALPHLGFAYSFGAQGSQFLRLNYSQAFSDRVLLNLNYDRSAGTGYLRNGNYALNNIKLQLQKKGDRHSLKLYGMYQNNTVNHPGGITIDTLIEDFGLEFTPVNKTNAFSINRQGNILLKNYLSFVKDSIDQLGILIRNDYHIINRVYYEEDELYNLYSSINIDSLSTRDQFNVPQIENGVGLYLQKQNFYVDGTINHVYWDYQNLGLHQDTTELNARSEFQYRLGKIILANVLYLNLAGRYNEWKNIAGVRYRSERMLFSGGIDIGEEAPDPVLRTFFGNHLDYSLSSITNQSYLKGHGRLHYVVKDSLLSLHIKGMFASITNPYLFNGDSYANDSITGITMFSIQPGLEFKLRSFRLFASGTFSSDNAGYIPQVQLKVRPQFVGRLFKAKKLEYSIGAEFTYCSEYNLRTYIPLVDRFDFYSPKLSNSSTTNLHGFFALGIDEFKFFVRYENAGYFWNDKTIVVQNGYTLAAPRLRLGITWDFFN